MHTITFTTDFGTHDWFVGTMKGVVLDINARAIMVDLTHEIPPGDIRAGAFALMSACRHFPKDTVHVVVVDPGVGSRRRAIAVQTANCFFVAPDNGVLSWALAREKIKSIRQLENRKYFLKTISRTFHGRDIFAPVAAHLSQGLPIRQLGPEVNDFTRIPWPKPRKQDGQVHGEIICVDHFGNAITNIGAGLISSGQKIRCEVLGRRKLRCVFVEFYGAVPVNVPVAVIGSSGFLEVAVNGGSAANRFGIEIGDKVVLWQVKGR